MINQVSITKCPYCFKFKEFVSDWETADVDRSYVITLPSGISLKKRKYICMNKSKFTKHMSIRQFCCHHYA